MSIQIGDLVEAISMADEKVIRRGIVTQIFDGGMVSVEMSCFATLCKNPREIPLGTFDSAGKWWIERKRKELQKRQEYKEAHPDEVTHYE